MFKKIAKVMKNPKVLLNKINYNRKNKIIEKYSNKDPNFFFIQIGANDGINDDPIRHYILRYNWKGILIEPLKDVFKKLEENYKDQNKLYFENSAISNKNGYISFYKSPSSLLSSIYPDNWFSNKNKGKSLKKRLKAGKSIKCKVKSLTFDALIKKYSVKKINLLQIDTEGYDYEIIKQINFDKITPFLICYEEHQLPLKAKKECKLLLKRKGYSIFNINNNVFAYIKNTYK